MAKGPIVTPEVEALIASVYKKHPKWKAPEIRNTVEGILRKKNPNLRRGWPSLSTVQKVLATVRKNVQKPSPQDEPWSLGTLDKYPIPPEALPKVLEEYMRHKRKGTALTIREAKWVARLSAIRNRGDLGSFTHLFAFMELLYELIDEPPDFAPFEKVLATLPDESVEVPKPPASFEELKRTGIEHISSILTNILETDPVLANILGPYL